MHRSKDSGTTDNLAKFLEKSAAADWTYGTGKAWKAPGGQGAPDSAGIVSTVTGTDGAISYVDAPDAKKNSLKAAAHRLRRRARRDQRRDASARPSPRPSGPARATTSSSSWTTRLKDAGAYPLVLVTYEITCEKGLPAEQAKLVKSFLKYTASADGQAELTELGYSQIPAELLGDVRKSVDALA